MNKNAEQLLEKLNQYPRRLNKKQKARFRKLLHAILSDSGYSSRDQKNKGLLRSVNIETDCDAPDYLIAAHYDTPTIMPPWMDGLFRLFGHTRQILIIVIMIFLGIGLNLIGYAGEIVLSVLGLSLLTLAFPNPRNDNDNTSGVLGCLLLARKVADDPILKDKVKFVFFDHEEWGLVGSSAFARYKRSLGVDLRRLRIITLDCIGRGDIPMVVRNGKSPFAETLHQSLKEQNPNTLIKDSGIIPLSDNYSFKTAGAVNISVFNRSLIPGGYVIDRVHLPSDKGLDFSRVHQVVDGVYDYMRSESKA